jgi:hypothetical protein
MSSDPQAVKQEQVLTRSPKKRREKFEWELMLNPLIQSM